MNLSHILYPALKEILVNRLQKILFCLETTQYFAKSPEQPHQLPSLRLKTALTPEDIPMNRIKRDDRIGYVSAIALKLARPQSSCPLELAHWVAEGFRQASASEVHYLSETGDKTAVQYRYGILSASDITVSIKPPGWIYFNITDRGLANWLQGLVEFRESQERDPIYPDIYSNQIKVGTARSSDLAEPTSHFTEPGFSASMVPFSILHSHARCCSLLNLGVRTGLIQAFHLPHLARIETQSLFQPCPIPWLVDATPQTAPVLRCHHSAERQLIVQMVETLDRLTTAAPPPDSIPQPASVKPVWNLLRSLSQAFEQFYANCQIFDPQLTPELAQTRLGLVFISQRLLYILFQRLRVKAPSQL